MCVASTATGRPGAHVGVHDDGCSVGSSMLTCPVVITRSISGLADGSAVNVRGNVVSSAKKTKDA